MATATALATEAATAASALAAEATASTAAATETTAPAATTLGALASLVHLERTTTNVMAIECVDSGLSLIVIIHRHKGKALGLSGVVVDNNLGFGHLAVSCEQLIDALVVHRVGQVAHVDFHLSSSFGALTVDSGMGPDGASRRGDH